MGKGGLGEEIKKRNPFELAEEEVMLNLARTFDRLQFDVVRLFKGFGISGAQYNVLRILRGAGDALPCGEISGRMVTQVPDVTRLVDRLEEAGLVSRSRPPEDRRVVLTEITACGLALLARLDEPTRAMHKAHLGHLTPGELAELNRLLVKAREGVGGCRGETPDAPAVGPAPESPCNASTPGREAGVRPDREKKRSSR